MKNEQFLTAIADFFGVHNSDDCVELETWTNGGVNMFVTLHSDESKSLFEQFKDAVSNFDLDDEIDVHRQDQGYRSAFTISQSLDDFRTYYEWLESIVENLESANFPIQ